MTNPEILQALEAGHSDITRYFSRLPGEVFFGGTPAHWGPAHHLGHLSLTHEAVTRGLEAKERLPAYQAAPRGFAELRSFYLGQVKQAPPTFLANNPFSAQLENLTQENLLASFGQKAQTLRQAITAWSETELDSKGLKHPLLGLISVREMLTFIMFHDQHHLSGVQNQLKLQQNKD